jgi:TrpR family trp operon transcriptional repressor
MHKRKAGEQNNQDGWSGFMSLCKALNELDEPQDFFDLYFTPKEREDLASRYLIVRELLKNQLNQRDMAEELDVSIAKITRGSNELKSCSPTLLTFIRKHAIDI